MIQNLIATLGITRDDWKLVWAWLIAAIVLLASLGPTDLTAYGIPVAAIPYIKLAALLIGGGALKLSTSPAPGGKS